MHASVRTLLSAALIGAASLSAHAAGTTPISALYVFGDSLSDSGNNYLALGGLTGPAPLSGTYIPMVPYPSTVPGVLPTYANGPAWVNYFAAGLGVPASAAPSLAGGGNNAFGGARTSLNGTAPGGFPPSLSTQLGGFLANNTVSPTAMYVLAGGGNDVRDVGDLVAGGADLVSTTLAGANAYASAMAGMVGALRTAGATQIVVWNVPDVGKTPASGSGVGPVAGAASFIANTFNSFLAGALAGSGVTIFDIYGLTNTIVANPGGYGFSNVTQACGFAGNACNPSTALWWDGIHPTAYAQSVIGQQMLAAVPEPGSVWMFMAGLAAVGSLLRRRA